MSNVFRSATYVVAAVLFVSGCNSNALTCSSNDVTQMVKELATEKFQTNTSGMVLAKNEPFKLTSIRTVSSSSSKCSCIAVIEMSLVFGEELKKAFVGIPGMQNEASQAKTVAGEITYDAQLTDDGKNVYVNVYGL